MSTPRGTRNAKGKPYANPSGESAFHIYSRGIAKKKNEQYAKLVGDSDVALESYEWIFERRRYVQLLLLDSSGRCVVFEFQQFNASFCFLSNLKFTQMWFS